MEAATQQVAEPTTVAYTIDPTHASAGFKVRHLMVSHVRGQLGEVTGAVQLDPADPSRSSVQAEVATAGIDTRQPDRDAHLRSPDFLDVAHHPTLTFASTSVRAVAPGQLEVTGGLTLRGVTRPVTLAVELSDEIRDPWGNLKRGVTATARLQRKEFGLTWNAALETGGVVVGDAVDVTIEAELVRAR